MTSPRRLKRWGLVAGAAFAGAAHGVAISPVLLEISPDRPVVTITISNPSDRPVNLQSDTLSWNQTEGADRYEATDELMIVPPLAEIAPRASQIFRVTPRRRTFGMREKAYRLVLEDVTPEAPAASGVGLTFRFRHNLPVFVTDKGIAAPLPRLRPCMAPAASLCVRLDNEGQRYLQLKRLTLETSEGRKELPAAGVRVLAGAWRQWVFERPARLQGPVHVRAETSAGPATTVLPAP